MGAAIFPPSVSIEPLGPREALLSGMSGIQHVLQITQLREADVDYVTLQGTVACCSSNGLHILGCSIQWPHHGPANVCSQGEAACC